MGESTGLGGGRRIQKKNGGSRGSGKSRDLRKKVLMNLKSQQKPNKLRGMNVGRGAPEGAISGKWDSYVGVWRGGRRNQGRAGK